MEFGTSTFWNFSKTQQIHATSVDLLTSLINNPRQFHRNTYKQSNVHIQLYKRVNDLNICALQNLLNVVKTVAFFTTLDT